jgi:AcrR family transcriptional regulator
LAAPRAGVAKGTIYLHFADKESLFQELIRAELSPVVATLEAPPDLPLRAVVELVMATFVREVLRTRRKNIVRLVLTEGRRFPKVAEFYYREVVGRGMAALRALMRRGAPERPSVLSSGDLTLDPATPEDDGNRSPYEPGGIALRAEG